LPLSIKALAETCRRAAAGERNDRKPLKVLIVLVASPALAELADPARVCREDRRLRRKINKIEIPGRSRVISPSFIIDRSLYSATANQIALFQNGTTALIL
jgi:hypothetical protein